MFWVGLLVWSWVISLVLLCLYMAKRAELKKARGDAGAYATTDYVFAKYRDLAIAAAEGFSQGVEDKNEWLHSWRMLIRDGMHKYPAVRKALSEIEREVARIHPWVRLEHTFAEPIKDPMLKWVDGWAWAYLDANGHEQSRDEGLTYEVAHNRQELLAKATNTAGNGNVHTVLVYNPKGKVDWTWVREQHLPAATA